MDYAHENFTFKNLGIYIYLLMYGNENWKTLGFMVARCRYGRMVIKVIQFQRVYITDEDDKKYNKLILDTPKTKESIRDIPLSSDLVKFFISISSK